MWGRRLFAILGWRYNSILLIKGVLIPRHLLIVRAFIPKR
jgi:hypothetical protein